ncbi:MAG TPA: hypothetical protein V6C99_03965 [Oculatellaceae cyanobacterium]|jgi:hypothetical protein
MRTTFILELDPELLEFVHAQQEFADPSMLVNHLLREEKKRQGTVVEDKGERSVYQQPFHVEMEKFLDEDTPAAD